MAPPFVICIRLVSVNRTSAVGVTDIIYAILYILLLSKLVSIKQYFENYKKGIYRYILRLALFSFPLVILL